MLTSSLILRLLNKVKDILKHVFDVEVDALLKQLYLLALSLLHGLQPDLKTFVECFLIFERLDHHKRVKDLLKLAILFESLNWHLMLRLTFL